MVKRSSFIKGKDTGKRVVEKVDVVIIRDGSVKRDRWKFLEGRESGKRR